MILLPAIDLMDGQVVRLQRGDAAAKTIYSDDPVAFAKKWEDEGGDFLHLVDLDGAFSGTPRNLETVKQIAASISIPCELGGGLRDESAIEAAFEAGVSRVVLGTRASESVDFVRSMAARHGSEKIAVGIDARDGMVAVKGWVESSNTKARDLALQVQDAGAGTIIYTDIATDGMLQGPNFSAMEELLALLDCQLIASGGVSSIADVEQLGRMEGLYGVIIGKALYDHKFSLPQLRSSIPR